jgi:gamma-glutamyltranspeptidase / glutathione hydrolase
MSLLLNRKKSRAKIMSTIEYFHRFTSIVSSLLILTSSVPVLAAFPRPTRSQGGMVTSAHPLATQAGVDILARGGNAIDAAVATTLAISVVEPFSAGIGGGGFMVVKVGDEMKTLDFRERAPQKASRNMYLDAQGKIRPNVSLEGHLAAGVPGTIAGLAAAHQKYGKLPWRVVVQPAIQLARSGFQVSELYTVQAKSKQKLLASNPAARAIFTRNGQPLQPGERLIQRDLARTLIAVARNPQNFYTGAIAQAIDRDMRLNKGLISLSDLKSYQPRWLEPLCGKFRQYRVCSMPPPSSGAVHLLQILNTIGNTDLNALGWHSPDALHLLIESMRIAYADRSEHLGDPNFNNIPVSALTNPAYAAKRRQEIMMDKARPSIQVKPATAEELSKFDRSNHSPRIDNKGISGQLPNPPSLISESMETSHLNVVDKQRNVVSLTFTVNYRFGAGVVVPGTGILLNDEMDDFAISPGVPNVFGLIGGEKNSIAPGKTPLSSMTPTIVTENGKFRMAIGAPGGSTIITTVLQILLNVLEYKMDIGAAVSAGRIHHQWLPDQLNVDSWGFDPATLTELRRQGHQIKPRAYWGNANAIEQLPDGSLEGAADPRGEGTAKGDS